MLKPLLFLALLVIVCLLAACLLFADPGAGDGATGARPRRGPRRCSRTC